MCCCKMMTHYTLAWIGDPSAQHQNVHYVRKFVMNVVGTAVKNVVDKAFLWERILAMLPMKGKEKMLQLVEYLMAYFSDFHAISPK